MHCAFIACCDKMTAGQAEQRAKQISRRRQRVSAQLTQVIMLPLITLASWHTVTVRHERNKESGVAIVQNRPCLKAR